MYPREENLVDGSDWGLEAVTVTQSVLDFVGKGWVGSALGVIGLIAAVVMFRWSRQRAIAAYQQRGSLLLGHNASELPSELSVTYRGRQIPRLTKTLLVIWNAGEKTINGADIVERDPLRIEIDAGGELLAVSVLKVSREAINFELRQDPKTSSTLVLFDFLDPGDGATVELLHTCENRFVTAVGTIKGVPGGITNSGKLFVGRLRSPVGGSMARPTRKLIAVVAAVGVLFACYGAFIYPHSAPAKPSLLNAAAMVFIGATYTFAALWFLWAIRRRYPMGLHTEQLDS